MDIPWWCGGGIPAVYQFFSFSIAWILHCHRLIFHCHPFGMESGNRTYGSCSMHHGSWMWRHNRSGTRTHERQVISYDVDAIILRLWGDHLYISIGASIHFRAVVRRLLQLLSILIKLTSVHISPTHPVLTRHFPISSAFTLTRHSLTSPPLSLRSCACSLATYWTRLTANPCPLNSSTHLPLPLLKSQIFTALSLPPVAIKEPSYLFQSQLKTSSLPARIVWIGWVEVLVSNILRRPSWAHVDIVVGEWGEKVAE